MKKQLSFGIVYILATSFTVALGASETDTGAYGNVFAGFAAFGNGNLDVEELTLGDGDFDIESGYSAGLLLGYDFGSFRLETEFTSVSGDIDSIDTNTGTVDVSSDYTSNSLMLNSLYDFELDSSPLVFSVGVGIGMSNVDYSKFESGGIIVADDIDDTVFMYQGIIRGSYAFSENAALGLSYRYAVTGGASGSGMVTPTQGNSVTSNHDFDSVGASLFEVFFNYRF